MATERMLRFVTVAREMPEKRPPNLRAQDFHEIYRDYAADKAAEQAARWGVCKKRMSCRKPPTHSQKFAAVFARKTGCVRAIALLKIQGTALSPSGRLKNI
jgi:hypothetical protein